MYENAAHLQFRASTLEKGLRILRSRVAPILKKQSGLLSLALIPNHETSQVTILSIWANATCAQLVEVQPEYRQAIQLLDPLMVTNRPAEQPLTMAEAPIGPVGNWSMN